MNKEEIQKIETELKPDGFTGYLFHLFTSGNCDTSFETVVLEEGACLALKGSAPVRERREQFLKIWEGCKNISDYLKKQSGHSK